MKTFVAATVLALSAVPSLAQQTSGASFYPQQDRTGREAALQTPVVDAGASVAYYPHIDRSGDIADSAALPQVRVAAVSYYPHADRTGDVAQVQPAVPAAKATAGTRASRRSADS